LRDVPHCDLLEPPNSSGDDDASITDNKREHSGTLCIVAFGVTEGARSLAAALDKNATLMAWMQLCDCRAFDDYKC
jgi:hypothetical protein